MQLRRSRSLGAFVAASLAVLALSNLADAAGGKDKDAQKLISKAMDEDYLNTDFAKAEKKLQEAVKLCGASNCSASVIGKVHVALGTVLALGLNKDATPEFVAALKADPNAALDPALSNPQLTKTFDEAKKKVKGGGGDDGGEKPEDGGEKPTKTKPGGDLAHTPVTEQQVRTPVPVYIEIPEDLGAEKVSLRYKPFGGDKWKKVDMAKTSKGWGATIPCEDVNTTGDVKYYIVAADASGDQVGSAGSLKDPYKVTIKQEIEGDPPSLPGKKPPEQCKEKADCPPGLPGCPNASGGPSGQHGDKGWGSSCEKTEECKEGYACLNGTCEEDKSGDGGGGGDTKKVKKNLISLTGGLDMLVISGADQVCGDVKGNQDAGYSCFYNGDPVNGNRTGQFYGIPLNKQGQNGVSGGFGIGGGRVLLGYDRQLLSARALLLGVRVGFAFGGSPGSDTPPSIDGHANPHDQAKSFFPFHGEARLTYGFSNGVMEEKKFHPYVFIGGGVGQVNSSVPVQACDTREADGTAVMVGDKRCAGKGLAAAKPVSLDAYQITGLNFIGAGLGTTFGLTPSFGLAAELKVMFMVPTFGVVFAPSLGPAFAF